MAFKYTTDMYEIRASVTESAANTFTEERINVSLDSLNREILVIHSVDLDSGTPSLVPGSTTQVFAQLTKNSQTDAVNISNPSCVSQIAKTIRADAAPGAAIYVEDDLPAAQADLPYLAIVATDDIYLAVKGVNNLGAVDTNLLVRARRAKADADTYAALVTSEAGLN